MRSKSQPVSSQNQARNSQSFVALQYRDFRLLWIGQLISQAGSQMQFVAVNWHVSQLASTPAVAAVISKPVALGVLGLIRVVPIIIFSLISGIVADVHDRRRVLMVTQIAMMTLSAVLGLSTSSGLVTLWLVYILMFLMGAAASFDNPARQALIPRLVPREHLTNAISLNAMMFTTATIVGPLFAGILIAEVSIASVYWINAASFLAVLVALILMRTPGKGEGKTPTISFQSLFDGLRFVFRSPIMWSTMALDFFATFFGSATLLLPIFAQDILHVGAVGYGWLAAAPAIGSLLASLGTSWLGTIRKQGPVVLLSVAVYGVATAIFGLSKNFALSFAALALVGGADTVSMVIRQTIRQLITPDAMRGRMTSVNMIFFMGGPQLGELEGGLLAAAIGAPGSVVIGGLGVLLVVAYVALKVPMLRGYEGEEMPA